MTLCVKQLHTLDSTVATALGRLLPQLSERLAVADAGYLQQVAAGAQTALFVAFADGHAVGMLTLVWYDVPSGRKAWVEDVVVDAAARGCGAATLLVRAAQAHAAAIGARQLSLTSSPCRQAARALYVKEGFEVAETSVFVLKTEKKK